MTDAKNFLVLFELKELRPDEREFRMNSTLFVPENVKVCIKVPRDAEYIANLTEIASAELDTQNHPIPEPLLTVKGSVYVLQEFEKAYKELKVTAKVEKEDDWDDVVEKEGKANPESKAKADWDDEPFGKEKEEKTNYDVDKEDW